MFGLFSTKKEQSKLDTAKAIMRGYPPYMFKSNYQDEPVVIDHKTINVACAVAAVVSLFTGIGIF